MKQPEKKKEKIFRASTGFEPVASAFARHCTQFTQFGHFNFSSTVRLGGLP